MTNPEAPKNRLDVDLNLFLDHEKKVEPGDQLETMAEFWAELGQVLPSIRKDMFLGLERQASAHPDKRIVPTPLSFNYPHASRLALVNRARDTLNYTMPSPFKQLNSGEWWEPSLWANPGTMHTALLQKDQAEGDVITVEGNPAKLTVTKHYALGYKTPEGETAVRQRYLEELVQEGLAVEGFNDDGCIWTFPVIDVRSHAPYVEDHARDLYTQVGALVSPETVIVIELMHLGGGIEHEVEHTTAKHTLTNETVYEVALDDEGSAEFVGAKSGRAAPQSTAAVYWSEGVNGGMLHVSDIDLTAPNYSPWNLREVAS